MAGSRSSSDAYLPEQLFQVCRMKWVCRMNWLEPLLDDLADERFWSYQPGSALAAEPMAIAALALLAHGRTEPGERVCRRLADLQAADGSVRVTAAQPAPAWTTGWAVLAWTASRRSSGEAAHAGQISRAVDWILATHGQTSEKTADMGHDTRLDGWPWVGGTHPWTEPTAINVLALKAAAEYRICGVGVSPAFTKAGGTPTPQVGAHPRCREAVAMLIDRLLPEGGCNYGNTSVFGQCLRPHVEPTGLAMVALAGESDASRRIERSLAYIERVLPTTAGAASLAYGVMGLAAHDRRPAQADAWLCAAARQTSPNRNSPLRRALLTLAAAQKSPFIPAQKQEST